MRVILFLTIISGIFSTPIFPQFRTPSKNIETNTTTNNTINKPSLRPAFFPKKNIPVQVTQETNEKLTPAKKIKQPFKKTPPYFSVLTRWGVSSIIGGSAPIHSSPTIWFILEGMIPLNSNKVYLYTQVRMSTPLVYTQNPISDIMPIMNMENTRMGFLIGIGGYAMDQRNDKGVGWHYTVNSGFVFEGAVANNHATQKFTLQNAKSLQDRFINIGAEINFRSTYSFHKHAGFVMGFDIGYLKALDTGDPFYSNLKKSIVSFDTVNFSATVGFSF